MTLKKSRTVKYFTNLLVLSTLVPLFFIIVWLLVDRYRLAEQKVYRDAIISANNIARLLDQDLVRMESGLEVLADSSELQLSDLGKFHESATRATQLQNVTNYVLSDISGKQILNTFIQFGDPLPVHGIPIELERVFKKRKTAFTNLFVGPVTKEYVLAMAVPVKVGGKVTYSLNTVISPVRISKIFGDLPKGWTGAVLDGNGTIIARSKDLDKFLGKPAVPPLQQAVKQGNQGTLETVTKDDIVVFTGFTRSTVSDWSVAVGAPKDAIVFQAYKEALLLSVSCLLVALISFFISRKVSYKIESSICGLIEPAKSLIEGSNVVIRKVEVEEVNFANDAILKAFESLQEKTYSASHDSLTGLPNRALFSEIMEKSLLSARRKDEQFCLLSIDLDGFKLINDNEGHPVGDSLLKEVAARIRSSIRESDTAARFGGDEFLVLLPNSDLKAGLKIARNLINRISQPYETAAGRISASIGISVFPESGNSVPDLIATSDRALYDAKSSGKGCVRPDVVNA